MKITKSNPFKLVSLADSSKEFYDACEAVDLPTTRRQFKKWQREQGRAWKYHKYGTVLT